MSYTPTPFDVSTDLLRCVFASLTDDKFNDETYKTFFAHAMKILSEVEDKIPKERLKSIKRCIKKSRDVKIPIEKRREDLLTASILCRN